MNNKWKKLVDEAKKARENAYAPHSRFKVGAAVLAKSGKIYSGCNVENASFSIGICAERNAISNAISNGEKEIKAVAVVADTDPFTPPCGACRQFIQEFGPKATVILANLQGKTKIYSQNQLLPYPFDFSLVRKKKSKK